MAASEEMHKHLIILRPHRPMDALYSASRTVSGLFTSPIRHLSIATTTSLARKGPHDNNK